MRAALDAGPLVLTSGGLHRYVSELSGALGRTFPEDEFPLLSDQPFAAPADAGPNVYTAPGPANWMEKRWWLYGAAQACTRVRADIFHGTNFAVPYRSPRASVLTLHDLSPWMDPAWHTGAGRVRTRAPRMIEREATMVITPSEAVRGQAIARFGLAPERVVAVPHGASPNFRPVAMPPESRPYFLFVGTLEPRKNIGGLIEAWRSVRTVRLLIAGRRRADFPQPAPEAGIEWLGEIPEAQLPALYSGALAVVYPSLYEGFGLPVLEAMQCGACVITSRDAAISEVVMSCALQAATVAELAQAMRAVIEQPELAVAFREKALIRAAEFSWERTARATHDVYREAIGRFART
jgi:glycosyltransferase involved in cell wall biosynthesis